MMMQAAKSQDVARLIHRISATARNVSDDVALLRRINGTYNETLTDCLDNLYRQLDDVWGMSQAILQDFDLRRD